MSDDEFRHLREGDHVIKDGVTHVMLSNETRGNMGTAHCGKHFVNVREMMQWEFYLQHKATKTDDIVTCLTCLVESQ